MVYTARLFYNNENWSRPVNVDSNSFNNNGYGVLIESEDEEKYRFGFEEWLFNEIPQKFNIGFLECYRQFNFATTAEKILLYTRLDNQFFHVGNLYGVEQINNNEIQSIKKNLLENNWNSLIQHDFSFFNDNRTFEEHSEYQFHWNSNQIVHSPNDLGFCFNVKYKHSELFKKEDIVNLTQLDNQNSFYHNWQRLSKRYNVEKHINGLSNNNHLKEYLREQMI